MIAYYFLKILSSFIINFINQFFFASCFFGLDFGDFDLDLDRDLALIYLINTSYSASDDILLSCYDYSSDSLSLSAYFMALDLDLACFFATVLVLVSDFFLAFFTMATPLFFNFDFNILSNFFILSPNLFNYS